MPISFMCACLKLVICRSSQFYNTQRTWQASCRGRNFWCFTIAEAICHAYRKLPIVAGTTAREVFKRSACLATIHHALGDFVNILVCMWFVTLKNISVNSCIKFYLWVGHQIQIIVINSLVFVPLPTATSPDPCIPNPCNNGACIPGGSCDCTGTGFEGDLCEIGKMVQLLCSPHSLVKTIISVTSACAPDAYM